MKYSPTCLCYSYTIIINRRQNTHTHTHKITNCILRKGIIFEDTQKSFLRNKKVLKSNYTYL